MLPEQQQRILGYFLEEANDHLNTIEQGLLNLESTLADSEMVNEIFRAAHSIKGGAAMLGLNSIQRTAHRLEDFFKILKECPSIQIEQSLESLFLQVFDNLKALLEQLQSGSSLNDSEASRLMSEVEPVFEALEHQLSVLVGQAGGSMRPDELPIAIASADVLGVAIAPAWVTIFEHSVPEALRELLQLFKQPETTQTRQQLQDCCSRLAQLGEEYDLSGWVTLCQTAAGAIANADNSYRTLAPVIIRELKQAQDLILANRAAEITTCEQLQALSINTFLLDWEEENTNISFGQEENLFTENYLTLASEIFTPPAIVDNEVGLIPQGQIDSLSDDDDLSSLFIPKIDSNNQWQETTDLLDVLNDSSDALLLQDIAAHPPISAEETSALNNLFGEAQDSLLDSIDEEPAFCNLFSAPTANIERAISLEELNPLDNSENVDLARFWTEETDSFPQLEAPSGEDAVNSQAEAIASAEIQFELVTPDDFATIPQIEDSWSAESEFDLSAIADSTVDSTDVTSTLISDSDATEEIAQWNSDPEELGLDFDAIPTDAIDRSLSLVIDNTAAESNLGWDDGSEGQLDLDFPTMELGDRLSFETDSSLEPLIAPSDDSNLDLMAGWDTSDTEALEMGFDSTVIELGDDSLSLESEPTLELGDNLSLEAESDSDLFAISTPSNTDDTSATLMPGWGTDSEEPLDSDRAADLFVSSTLEEIAVPNFLPEESTIEIPAEDTALTTEWDTGEPLEMGFDSASMELSNTFNLELEPSSDSLTDVLLAATDDLSSAELIVAGWDASNTASEMPVDDESTTASITWDTEEVELGLNFDATPAQSEDSFSCELEPILELDDNFSLVAEAAAEDTASMAGWDVSSEALEMGFDSTPVELNDALNLETELSSDSFTDASLATTEDLSSTELTAGWDAGNTAPEMPVDDRSAITSVAWDTEEAELGLNFEIASTANEDAPSCELEPSLELDDNFSLVAEAAAEDTALMAGWDASSDTLDMGFDTATTQLGDSLSFESESSLELFAPLVSSMPVDEQSDTASTAWNTEETELDLGVDATPAQSEDSFSCELEPSLELDDNFSLVAEAAAEDTALMAGWDAGNDTLDMSFDTASTQLGDSLSFESESSLELFAPLVSSMPVDEQSDTASTAWNTEETELDLGVDATPAQNEDAPSCELEPSLELDDNFSLVAEAAAEDTALMAGWDAGSDTLDMSFDTAATQLGDNLNLELEPSQDFQIDASSAATVDLSSSELMVEWNAGSESLEISLDGDVTANASWNAGEEELDWSFDATTESDDSPSLESEPSLELNDRFSLITESDVEQFSTSTAAIIDENITELMSVVESIYQDAAEDETSLEEAQADFLADSGLEADDDFPELNALLQEEESVTNAIATAEALLDLSSNPIVPVADAPAATASSDDDFADLDLLLQETPKTATATSTAQSSNDDFSDLDLLLQETPAKPASVVPTQPAAPPQPAAATPSPRRPAFEQMMRVPVKQLDSIGNMVGELVVYRNSLEQDQERLRQFLDNLLHQVQQLGDVGTRMQELYERSLLEASLLNSRQGARLISVLSDDSTSTEGQHATGANFDALEMDRFTGFHTLAQEMIELIVRVREASSDIEFVTGETEQVARNFRQVTTHLQEGITRSRMVPFSQIAERLPRAVRDIALKYGKQAELQVEGNETLIDKGILEQLYDPMTHLVNNAITHGIETPEERIAKGKAAAGKITIRAFHQGNQTVITVSDDGAGIDPEKVKAKATANGIITPAEADNMDRLDVFNLIFQPGFSTKEQVDQFAGRGIGMDVVLTSLKQMRGAIHTDSNLGKGTNFTIRLPLTLSICKALCCVSDKARIAFPMDGVEQMIDIPVDEVVANAEGQTCIPWRDSLLPFRPLKELLGFTRQLGRGSIYGSSREDNAISIVILRSADTFFALQVDQVLGEQEIVIKQFEAPAPKPPGIAGATILGDGRIMPIADVLELIDLSVGRLQKDGRGTVWSPRHIPAPPMPTAPVKTEPLVLIIDDSITVRELLSMTFTNAGYRVEQARDGQEAWDKLRDGLPCDLVFCDIEMPRMDGLELLSRMQKEERLSQLPIAMLTSRGSDRHRQMALQLGASGYFTKPYLEEALLDGAQRMLRGEVLIAASSASSSV